MFLASPASDYVNGQIIYVDGGMLAVLEDGSSRRRRRNRGGSPAPTPRLFRRSFGEPDPRVFDGVAGEQEVADAGDLAVGPVTG